MRSGQVCTPVHHLPAWLGAPSINFLSRKLIFSSCEKQKEEKCVNAEQSGSWGRKLLPRPKEVAAISPGQASLAGMPPGCPYAVPEIRAGRRQGAFPTCYCTGNEQTLRLPFPLPAPPQYVWGFFFPPPPKIFSEAQHRAQARESTTHG